MCHYVCKKTKNWLIHKKITYTFENNFKMILDNCYTNLFVFLKTTVLWLRSISWLVDHSLIGYFIKSLPYSWLTTLRIIIFYCTVFCNRDEGEYKNYVINFNRTATVTKKKRKCIKTQLMYKDFLLVEQVTAYKSSNSVISRFFITPG